MASTGHGSTARTSESGSRAPAGDGGLGRHFGRLWAASTVSGLGDGVTQVAGALAVAALTRDPLEVSGLVVVQQLPLTLFALPGGVLVDRLDRRRLMATVCLVRAAALAVAGVAMVTGRAALPALYAAFFVVGCAGLLFENASVALLPSIVDGSQLDRANGRLRAAAVVTQQLAAKPLGGLLFTLAAWAPFLVEPPALLVAAGLIAGLPPGTGAAPPTGPAPAFHVAIRAGVRWLARHTLLRTLSITVGLSNLGLGATFSILVLVARQRLGLGPIGYATLLTAGAAGGIAGGLAAARITATLGAGTVLRAGLLVELLVHLCLALTHSAITATVMLALLSLHLVVFSTIGASLRQTLVPAAVLGRVHSAYRLVTNGGMFLGSVLGGVLGRYAGLTAPFWFAVACVATLIPLCWRVLTNDRIRAARADALAGSEG